MLSGGSQRAFPEGCRHYGGNRHNAELGVDYWAQYQFLHRSNAYTHKVGGLEASLAEVAFSAVCYSADKDGDGVIDATEGTAIVLLDETGKAADLITKYRPPCPVFVCTPSKSVLIFHTTRFGQIPCQLDGVPEVANSVLKAWEVAKERDIPFEGRRVILVASPDGFAVQNSAVATVVSVKDRRQHSGAHRDAHAGRRPRRAQFPCCRSAPLASAWT